MKKGTLRKITSIFIVCFLLITQAITYAEVEVGIEDQQPDIVAPIIESISVSSNELSPTTPVKVIAEISDELSGFSDGSITYTKPNNQTVKLPFALNTATNKYEATITVPSIDVPGEWKVTNIFLKDKKDNTVYLTHLATQSNGEQIDFSTLHLNVTGVTSPPEPTDKEAPVLQSIKVTTSQEITVNEKIELTAEVTDNESGVSTVRATYRTPSGKSKLIYLYENTDGQFVGSYPIGKYEESGEWTVSSVYLTDRVGNSKSITSYLDVDNNQISFENLSVTVIGTTIDSEAPVLHDIWVTSNEVKANERIEVAAEITDNESGVDSVRVNFKKPSGKTFYIYLYKNSAGQFVGSVPVGQYDERGSRTLTSVYLSDNVGNSQTVTSYLDVNNNLKDFSHCTVEVTGTTPDWEGPEFRGGTISVEQISPTQAAVKLVINVEDNLSGITNSSLSGSYRKPMTKKPYNLNFIKQGNQYTATILLDKYDEIGWWVLENLSIRDDLGNPSTSNKMVGGSPFSEFNIHVIDGRIAVTPGTPNSIWFEAPDSLTNGQSYQLSPVLKYSNTDVEDADVTTDSNTTYSTSNPDLMKVDSKGLITVPDGAGSGYVTLEVAYGTDISKSAIIKINEGTIESFLQVTPMSTTLHAGQSEQLKVVEIYDGARKDVTHSSSGVTYSSSDPSLVTVTQDGLIQATSEDVQGTATIQTTYNGLVAKTTVKVSKPVVKSLTISPPSETLLYGSKMQLVVKAFMSDGSTKDVTEGTTGTIYTSSDESRATVDANGLIQINAQARSGTVTIKAINSGVATQSVITINGIPELTGIQVTPASVTLKPGESQNLKVEALYTDGTVKDVTDQTTYRSGNPSLASVDSTGLVAIPEDSTGGTVNIAATFEGKAAAGEVTIPFKPVLDSLTFTPNELVLKPGESYQLGVQANYSDESRTDVTSEVAFESSNESLATVDVNGFITVNSDATGGTVYIRGTYEGKGGATTVTIPTNTPPTVASLEFSADKTEIKQGESTQVKVVATYIDGTTEDVTAQALLNSSNPILATVDAETGIVTIPQGAAGGTVYIRGSYGGKGGAVTLTIPKLPYVTSLTFDPEIQTVKPGDTVQVKVIANYSDGTIKDVTSVSDLKSTNINLATVDPLTGLVEIPQEALNGTVYIQGAYGGKGNSAKLTVSKPYITGISFNPGKVTIKKGDPLSVKVEANYSDGSVEDVTAQTIFSSSNPAVAIVDESGNVTVPDSSKGGTVYIRGTYGGKGGATTVTVLGPPTVTKLLFEASSNTLDKDAPVQVNVTAVYSDETTEDVTSKVLFSSSNTSLATVDAAGLVTLAEGAKSGTVYIRGSYEGKGGAATLVIPPQPYIVKIVFDPLTATLNKGSSLKMNVSAHYSNGDIEDITSKVAFTSSNTNIATVDSTGFVSVPITSQGGTVYIRGSYGGKGAASTVKVQ